ncbi:hypothetical protein DPMN_032939 [Dreissena polymorpha]|uniref:Uncharacterized protein n=1 Tax=Dreissena polymorpha TaxID=45954 RepID=A0A9D4M3Y8_DREPO|nr:hypothetical protein DPMN_032939 [Dreissena polymorpha]
MPVHDPTTYFTVNTTANLTTAKPLPTTNEENAAPHTTNEVEPSLVKDIARTLVDALMNANNLGLSVSTKRESASNNALLNTKSDILVKVGSVSQKTTDTAIMNKLNSHRRLSAT